MTAVPGPQVRAATPADVPAIVELVFDLARYEKAEDECHLTAPALTAALFGEQPAAAALVAATEPAGVGGFALYFRSFSTWDGVPGLYLEDLYVRPELRGSGLGRALLAELAASAVRDGYTRVEWSVLDWNAPAIAFYRRIGAVGMDEWTKQRLSGDALARLADGPASSDA